MPIVSVFLARDEDPLEDEQSRRDIAATEPENQKLWMPSVVPREKWGTGIAIGLAEKEARMRVAEADDALHQVRKVFTLRFSAHSCNAHIGSSLYSYADGPR